uniref:Glycosyltransferase 61 catalytic domain-containing protein n=1 Tax=Eutreptiella gymnastica TaxID=73025 RepID=A0A7S1IQF2_9EUGL
MTEMRRDYLDNVRQKIVGEVRPAKMILIYSRNNFTSRRSVREEQELYTALVDMYSADIVHFWTGIYPYAFRDSITLLSQGVLFLGPHGAGLAAQVFLGTNATVIEFRPRARSERASCFELMAYACNNHFHVYTSEGDKQTPMSINVSEVVDLVRRSYHPHQT